MLAFLLLAAIVYGAIYESKTVTARLSIVDTGDTAGVLKFNEFTAIDSFVYQFDLEDTTNYKVDSLVKWVSPLMVTRLSVTGPIDSTQVYCCSVDCGTHVYGFTLNPPGTDTTAATLVGSMADSIKVVAGMKDTITAEDSITYVKIIGKIAQEHLEGDARWAIHFTTDAGVLDTASSITTIAMVCDSMPATVAATDSIKDHYTAANDGDTVWTLTANKKGRYFIADVADTSLDTAWVTVNKESWSSTKDTIDLNILVFKDRHVNGLYGKFILKASSDTVHGIGDADSGFLYLYTTFDGQYYQLATDSSEGLPCTLRVAIGRDTTGGSIDPDTLFKTGLSIGYKINDSCSDTTMWPSYDLEVDYLMLLD